LERWHKDHFFFLFLKRWYKGQFHSSLKLLEFQRASIYVGVHQDFSLKTNISIFNIHQASLSMERNSFIFGTFCFRVGEREREGQFSKSSFPHYTFQQRKYCSTSEPGFFLISTSKFHIRQEESKQYLIYPSLCIISETIEEYYNTPRLMIFHDNREWRSPCFVSCFCSKVVNGFL